MQPTVLIATTCRWFPTARLAMALAKAGFAVEVVCPSDHPVGKTHAARRIHHYRALAPVASFSEAVLAARPGVIVSGDDLATWHLHELYAQEKAKGPAGQALCELIERSFGPRESFPIVYSRPGFLELADQEGVRVPKTRWIASPEDLKNWTSESGFPTVLKANGTSGGDGVRVVYSRAEAEDAFKMLQAPPLFARAAKRALLDGDATLVWPTLRRQRSTVSAQTFVPGREATSAIACHQGKVLAVNHFEVLGKGEAAGPATVLRRIDHPEMALAAGKMVRRLNLSGIIGFDFMLESQTGNAYLIEINPRATQIGHLPLGAGHDLPAALFGSVAGTVVRPAPKVTENDTIALFPREWQRDPHSKFLQTAYHDVPWEEPDLILAAIGKRGQESIGNLRETWQQNSTVQVPRS